MCTHKLFRSKLRFVYCSKFFSKKPQIVLKWWSIAKVSSSEPWFLIMSDVYSEIIFKPRPHSDSDNANIAGEDCWIYNTLLWNMEEKVQHWDNILQYQWENSMTLSFTLSTISIIGLVPKIFPVFYVQFPHNIFNLCDIVIWWCPGPNSPIKLRSRDFPCRK